MGHDGRRESRRRFLRLATATVASLLLPGGATRVGAYPSAMNGFRGKPVPGFFFAQAVYRGGEWDPEPTAWTSLQKQIASLTSIEAADERVTLELHSPRLFTYPFLYMSGTTEFQSFQQDEIDNIRKYLNSGGTLLADDCAGTPGYGFDASFRREMQRVYPDGELRRIPSNHTVFRSFFLIRSMGGKRIVSPFLEGMDFGSRTPVIYSPNGLGSAWAKDSYGRWIHSVTPGGERQRELAFQLGINIIMYALCADYKQDRIHLPFLRQKI